MIDKFTMVTGGKFASKTLPQIVFADLDYFCWMRTAEGLLRTQALHEEYQYISECIKKIRINKDNPDLYVVEYVYYPGTHAFVRFDIVEKERPPHTGGSPTTRSKHINLNSFISSKNYDKSGAKFMIESLKNHYFGESYIMTKKRCEDFFKDTSNFV